MFSMDYQWLWVWCGALDDRRAQDTEGWIGGFSAFDSAVRGLHSESGRTCPLAILSKVLKNVRPPSPRLAAAQGRPFFSTLPDEGVIYGVRILSGRPWSCHAERELFGFRGCHDQHFFATTVQIAFAFFQDGDDATAILAFVDIGFFAHDGPPCGSVGRYGRAAARKRNFSRWGNHQISEMR